MPVRRILVVEDQDDARDALAELLRLWNHDVHAVSDGEDALAIALAWRPDIVLLDISLPGISGCEVARRLRMLPEGERLTIIAVSGYGRPQDVQRAVAAGCDVHLLKPFDPSRLGALIEAGDDLRVRIARGRR